MVSNDAYGGFLLPEGFSPNLLTIADEEDPFAGRTTPVDMQVPDIKIPARVDSNHSTSVAGGVTVSRSAETIDATATRLEFEQVRLEAHELVGASHASETLLRFSPMSFISILEASFAAAFRAKHVDEILNGEGGSEFVGIVNAAATVSQAAEASQTAATIYYANIINMRSRLYGYQNAIWVANHDTLPQLMTMNFTASAIAPIWQPSAREDKPSMLLGRPIFFSEYCATLGTVGDIVCANMTQYLEGTLMPLESAESIHVRFLARERTFRFVLMNCGAPWWRSALTPAKSSTTLSPFVVLATRS
jgi:HK97 family phage major capsid protein